MSDEVESGLEVEVDTGPKIEDEIEVEVGEAQKEEKKTEVVTLTPEQFAELQAKGDSAKALSASIDNLGMRLGAPQQAANSPQQTPEEFYAEHSDDMFDKEKGPKFLAEYNRLLNEREYGPILSSFSTQLASTKRELLEAKDPMFKKYADEVDALVKAQPKAVQMQADVLDRAWLTVREKHRTEIMEEEVNKKVNELLDAKLKELGIEKGSGSSARPSAYVNSESGRGSSASAGRKVVRLPDEATKKKLEAEANRLGLEFSDYLRVKGYVK